MSVKTASEATEFASEAEIAFSPEAAFLAKRASFLTTATVYSDDLTFLSTLYEPVKNWNKN